MRKLYNIEKMLNKGFNLTIKKEKFGKGFIVGLDNPKSDIMSILINECCVNERCTVAFAILSNIKNKYPETPIEQKQTLSDALISLDNVIYKFYKLPQNKQLEIFNDINKRIKEYKQYYKI